MTAQTQEVHPPTAGGSPKNVGNRSGRARADICGYQTQYKEAWMQGGAQS